jgi:hypothetical protein
MLFDRSDAFEQVVDFLRKLQVFDVVPLQVDSVVSLQINYDREYHVGHLFIETRSGERID